MNIIVDQQENGGLIKVDVISAKGFISCEFMT